jgi:hypothetical protein
MESPSLTIVNPIPGVLYSVPCVDSPTMAIGWTLAADTICSVAVNVIRNGAVAGTASLSNSQYYSGSFSFALNPGDSLAFQITSAANVRQIAISLAVQPTLAQAQAQALTQLKADCDALVLAHYPQTNQTALVVMLMQAAQGGLTNRAAYIEQVWTWATSITTLYYQQAAAIQAATTTDQVAAITWSAALAALGATDPNVTILGAMNIGN